MKETWKINNEELTDIEKDELSKIDKEKLILVNNLSPSQIRDLLNANTINTKKDLNLVLWENWYLKAWLIGDTHLWSKHCAYDALWEYYDKAKDKWVSCVLHAWDLIDWENIYKWHTYELAKHWFDEQLADVISNYPKNWLDTYFINWNHDESFLKTANIDTGKQIERLRNDLHYLWFYDADIVINWIKVNLHHWASGQSYAKSYKAQKYIESINPVWQPDIFLLGHYHDVIYMLYRHIHSFMPGAFQTETLFSKRLKLWNTIGWWIIEVEKTSDGKSRINMEYLKF